MTSIPLSTDFISSLPSLIDLIRRSIDGTVLPIFVDYTNQRVLIGSTSASTTNPGKLEVTGDIKIIGTSDLNGLVVADAGGTNHHCRIGAVYDASTTNWVLIASPVD